MNSGIYKITNIITGDFYIGSTKHFNKREWQHFNMLNKGNHKNSHLQCSYNKHGKEAFKFEIICKCSDEIKLKLEQWYLDNLKPTYNKSLTVKGRTVIVVSGLTRQRLSNALKGKKLSKEHSAAISKGSKGRKFTEEHKLKLSLSNLGKNKGRINWNHEKPIIQYDLNMNFIKEWNSVRECCIVSDFNRDSLVRNLRNERKSYKNYIFKYKI